MKITSSLKSLRHRKGSILVRRGKKVVLVNNINPKFKAKQ